MQLEIIHHQSDSFVKINSESVDIGVIIDFSASIRINGLCPSKTTRPSGENLELANTLSRFFSGLAEEFYCLPCELTGYHCLVQPVVSD